MTNASTILNTCDDLRAAVESARSAGKRIGLVPTMGALHAGHMSLVAASNAECDATIVTIFVNPTQFAAGEDLAAYPRTLDADLAALAGYEVDMVFAPPNKEIYPADFDTYVNVDGITQVLEGRQRPTHFRGVATVCTKLFNLAQADVAYFGQKDFQQTLVIRRITADLNIPTEIRVCPIVREQGGLAMSSRNVYLSPDERQRALALSKSLNRAHEMVTNGERDAAPILAEMRKMIDETGGIELDYLVLVNPDTLEPVATIAEATLAAVAARVGETRLIDNELLSCRGPQ